MQCTGYCYFFATKYSTTRRLSTQHKVGLDISALICVYVGFVIATVVESKHISEFSDYIVSCCWHCVVAEQLIHGMCFMF